MKKHLSETELLDVLKEREVEFRKDAHGQVVVYCFWRKDAGAIVRDLWEFPKVAELELQRSVFKDKDASHLAALVGLRKLNLVNAQITGCGLSPPSRLGIA